MRTHVFRGTLQYVVRDDVRWMLGLVAGRKLADATRGGAQPTRAELATAPQRAGIATDGRQLTAP